jgi:hypothetical protein
MTSNKLQILNEILEECSKEHLDSVFSPIVELPSTSTKAEMISHCINKELANYGFKTYTSPDKTMVLVNDEAMCKVADFLNQKGFTPFFTKEQIERLKTIQRVSYDNKVNIYWAQTGFRRKYYYLKQYGFNGVQLYNILNLNSRNAANALLSPTGSAAWTIGGILALSWSGSLFFATLENYIPNHWVKTKAVVCGTKFVLALPIRTSEATANGIFGFVERFVFGSPLPTNITQVYKLEVGPKLKDLPGLKKSVLQFLKSMIPDG